MSKRDYYEVLGLTKGATDKEIKKAYRKMAKTHHPDAGGDADTFAEINEANEVLSDPNSRAKYDSYGHEPPMGGGGFSGGFSQQDLEDLMNNMGFGNGGGTNTGGDIRVNLKVSLEEAFTGAKKTFNYNRKAMCEPCSGKGGETNMCSTCQGRRIVIGVRQMGNMQMQQSMTCPTCRGEGEIISKACDSCSGLGTKDVSETVTIDVPHGVESNQATEMPHLGDGIRGGECGDLIVIITVATDQRFIRDGNNLRMKVGLSYDDLVLGNKVEVPTIDGKNIRVTIPEFSKVGQTLNIPNKGMRYSGGDTRGNFLLELDIIMPSELSNEEKETIEKLRELGK